MIGVTGDGRSITGLFGTAINTARDASEAALMQGAGMELGAAAVGWNAGGIDVVTKLLTVTSDTSRAAMGLETVTREGIGYTRRLVGASCARCVVLAGRTYRSPVAFDRHPRCDCEHVPASTRQLDLIAVDARSHFDDLSRDEQDRQFTRAGAQAIRDGADINQVVNARRGAGLSFASGRITKAEAEAIRNSRGGRARALPVTTEGTTRRGIAGGRLGRDSGGKKVAQQRLMPESIYQAADGDRDLAMDLLYQHGYLMERPRRARQSVSQPRQHTNTGNSVGRPPATSGPRIPPPHTPGRGTIAASSGPPQFPRLPDGSAMPFTPADVLPLELEDFKHIDGIDGMSGGHLQTSPPIPNATRFPAWVRGHAEVQEVIDAALANVSVIRLGRRGNYESRSLVDLHGTAMVVETVLDMDRLVVTVYPLSGDFVERVTPDAKGSMPRPLDLGGLQFDS
ncbi:hypothetical protein [Gordonia sp. (in: high G+C Gram-positive bacteria)]|uniref:hypothetical protein n=1 Tax=Gordonia sp. (in: high G+C Gram-positive bacteria) TaxID=84139 RepID=UPI003C73064A